MGLTAPIVLIHGYPLDGSMWAAQAAALQADGHQVLTPDLPGFGGTPPPDPECTIGDYASFVHTLIREQAGGRAIVGGLSMGGYVVLELLQSYPEAVAAALLIDTRPEADTPEVRAGRQQSAAQIQQSGMAAVCYAMLERLVSRHAAPQLRQTVRDMMLRQPVAGVLAALHAMARRPDSTDLLATLKIPMLLVVGDHDVITPPSVAFSMHNHMPHAMLVQVADAGHLTPMEQPAAVTQAIKTFLGTLVHGN